MIEFNDIDFRPNRPEMPPMHHRPEPHHPEHHHPCPPPFDPELKRVFDLAVHADHVAHKALDVASYANLDATAAKKLTEQTLVALNNVTRVANEANFKVNDALANIDLLRSQARDILAELNTTLVGAGLAEDGSYVQDRSTNYIQDADSLADADKRLDTALTNASEKVSRLELAVNNVTTKINFIPNIIEAVGLNNDGTYLQSEGHSIISTATSVLDATEKLEEAVKQRATKTELTSINEGITLNRNDIGIIKGKLGDLSRLDENETIIRDIENIETTVNGLTGNVSSLLGIVGNCPIPSVNNENVMSTLTCEFNDLVIKAKCNESDIANLTTKLGNITIRKTSTDGSRTSYQLYVDGVAKGETIVVEQDSVVDRGSYDSSTNEIVLVLNTGSEIRIPANGIFTPYDGGLGISVDRNQINAKIDPNSERFLTVTTDGLKISGIKTYVDEEYVAGPGLFKGYVDEQTGMYYDRKNDQGEWPFAIKIEENSRDYLKVTRDGLGINVDALKDAIGGGSEIDPSTLAGKHLVFNPQTNKLDVNVTSLVQDNEFITAVRNLLLWEEVDTDKIQPKNSKNVLVNGTIEATGAIYSGQD